MYYNDFIKRELKAKGATLIGFADLSKIEIEIPRGFNYGIVIAKAIDPLILSKVSTGPHIYYYNEIETIDKNLKKLSLYVEKKIEEKGFKAFSEAHAQYNDHYIMKLPNKTIATYAGLGWIGKNAELINDEYGAALRVITILTNMPFRTARGFSNSKCGQCVDCMISCPARAIKGANWNLKSKDNDLIAFSRCRDMRVERGLPFNLTKGTCDICIESCPYTKRYIKAFLSDEYRYFNIKRGNNCEIKKELL